MYLINIYYIKKAHNFASFLYVVLNLYTSSYFSAFNNKKLNRNSQNQNYFSIYYKSADESFFDNYRINRAFFRSLSTGFFCIRWDFVNLCNCQVVFHLKDLRTRLYTNLTACTKVWINFCFQ